MYHSKKNRRNLTPPKISANHPEAAKNQSQAATKKHLRGDIGCEDEHFRIKSLYFNDIQYHLPFSTKQRTGFWDDGLQGLEVYPSRICAVLGDGTWGGNSWGVTSYFGKGFTSRTINMLNTRSWSFA